MKTISTCLGGELIPETDLEREVLMKAKKYDLMMHYLSEWKKEDEQRHGTRKDDEKW